AQLGTAFIACPESSADAGFRAALLGPGSWHTVMTSAISGRPARCLANRFTALGDAVDARAIPSYPIAYDAGKALHAAAKAAGEYGYGAQWAGQGAPLARSLPAATLVAELRSEMERALRRRNVEELCNCRSPVSRRPASLIEPRFGGRLRSDQLADRLGGGREDRDRPVGLVGDEGVGIDAEVVINGGQDVLVVDRPAGGRAAQLV